MDGWPGLESKRLDITTLGGYYHTCIFQKSREAEGAPRCRDQLGRLEAGVDGLGFEGEDAEDAFVDATQGFAADEAFEGFNAEGEFAHGQGALATQATRAQAVEVFGQRIFGAVDDAEVLAAATFDRGLNRPTPAFLDEAERLDDHTFSTFFGVIGPPSNCCLLAFGVQQIHLAMLCGEKEARVRSAKRSKSLHVPKMIAVEEDVAFRGEKMKGSKFEVVERLDGPAIAAIGSNEARGEGSTLAQAVAQGRDGGVLV